MIIKKIKIISFSFTINITNCRKRRNRIYYSIIINLLKNLKRKNNVKKMIIKIMDKNKMIQF